jgi:hypothetical protein
MIYSTLAGLLCLVFSFTSFADSGLTLKLHSFTNATPEDAARVTQAMKLLEHIVNEPSFKDRILNMNYKIGNTTYQGYTQTEMTPTQVLHDIETAQENYNDGSKGVIDLFLDSYYQASSTVGYTSVKDKYIHMNRYIQGSYSSAKTAGNIFHEWMHKIGYDHSSRNNVYRPHSVPYKLGYLVAEMVASKMAGKNQKLRNEFVESFQSAEFGCDRK